MDQESIQITLNSRYATKYINNTHSNCDFYLPFIDIPIQHHIYLSVKSATIPYSFYNINTNNNNLTYIVEGVEKILYIEVGNYNAIQFASYCTKNMPNFNVTYNAITNRFVFTNSLYDFSFSPYSTCFRIIGFDSKMPNQFFYSVSKKLTSINCINMQTVQCINIKTNFPMGNIDSYNMKANRTICCFPVNAQPNSNIVYENNTDFRSNLYTNTLTFINIHITDQDNNLIFLNGLDWTVVLQLDIVSFI